MFTADRSAQHLSLAGYCFATGCIVYQTGETHCNRQVGCENLRYALRICDAEIAFIKKVCLVCKRIHSASVGMKKMLVL